VLALRSAGRSASSPPVAAAARWLAAHQNADGGFSTSGKGVSFVDETGAALQALAAAGRRDGKPARRALGFLRRAQGDDGGYGQSQGYRSNAQSTAWAVQGIVATGTDPTRLKRHGARSPVAYLASLQQRDGSYRYSRASVQTPVWVTAQVVTALRHKAFPLRPVRRAAGGRRVPARKPAPKPHARVRQRHIRTVHRTPARAVALRSTSATAPRTAAKRDSGGPSPLLYILLPAAAIAAGLWLGRRRARRRR
jgi:Squalene-hopene cyclase C-terminal domain